MIKESTNQQGNHLKYVWTRRLTFNLYKSKLKELTKYDSIINRQTGNKTEAEGQIVMLA